MSTLISSSDHSPRVLFHLIHSGPNPPTPVLRGLRVSFLSNFIEKVASVRKLSNLSVGPVSAV